MLLKPDNDLGVSVSSNAFLQFSKLTKAQGRFVQSWVNITQG